MQDTPNTEIDKASWIWLTLRDEYIDCRPVATNLDGWYPEAPGERAPQSYDLRNIETGEVERVTVYPVEPWSAYDAITDVLTARGWFNGDRQDSGTCEHGMAADLCAGPGHYPEGI
jgi:hypothetical protein